MRTKLTLISICLVCLLGCGGRPEAIVIENRRLVIYHSEKKEYSTGRFEYWVRDNSNQGWTLITDQEFQVGDELQITKKSK